MSNEQANVVVVVFDTARARDTVPADESPLSTLARLADVGVEYRNAFATAPWTLPSHAGLLTGTYTSKHDTHGDNRHLDESLPTLPAVFSEHGYETRAISNNTWIGAEFGFDRGFDSFHAAWSAGSTDPGGPPPDGDVSEHEWRTRVTERCEATGTTDLALDWIEGMEGDPFFLFLNYIDAHFDYTPPREYVADRLPPGYDYDRALDILDDPRAVNTGQRNLSDRESAALRALYRGELAHLDDSLSRIVTALRDVGEWENTVLVVTSDHGENVGDYGYVGHQYCLYDTLLHVPLVVVGGSFDGASDSDRLVQTTDLAPTLLDEVGVDAPGVRETFQGRSFHPDSSAPPREFVIAEHVTPQPPLETLAETFGGLPADLESLERELPLRAIRTTDYKLVLGADDSRELYHVAGDPAETEDVADGNPAVCDRLGRDLDRWLASFDGGLSAESTGISAETEKRLSDLGYL